MPIPADGTRPGGDPPPAGFRRKHKGGAECMTQHRLTEIQSKRNTSPIFDGLCLKRKPSIGIMGDTVQSI